MVSPSKLSRKKFEQIKKINPKKAEKIETRASGEIYGLKPIGNYYGSDEIMEITYEEGKYVEGAE